MDDMLKMLKNRHVELNSELDGVLEKLKPLEELKKVIDEKIKTIARLISLEEESNKISPDPEQTKKSFPQDTQPNENNIVKEKIIGPLSGKNGYEAYKELIDNNFKEKTFKEQDIREEATKQGLLINGSKISPSYSRGLLVRFLDKGQVKKIKKGVYIKQDEGSFGLLDINRSE